MKAAVYEGKECIIVKDVPDPVLGDGEMLLEIEACTVCGVDLRTYRHGDKKIIPPRILGHEFCGKVIESKNDNANVQVGDRVVMYIVLPCGICMYCKSGNMNLCDNRTTMSYHYDGAYAQYMKVPAVAVKNGHLFKVGEDIESKYATLTEPLGCVINADNKVFFLICLHKGVDKVTLSETATLKPPVIARSEATKQSRQLNILDCFVATLLAMTVQERYGTMLFSPRFLSLSS